MTHTESVSNISLPHVQSDFDANDRVIYSKVSVYRLWGTVTTAFRLLSHPQSLGGFRLSRYASVERCITHKDAHMFAESCVIQKITQHPLLSNSFWLRSLKENREPHGKSLCFGNISKASQNLRKRSIYRWEQLDFHHSTTSLCVYMLACVVYAWVKRTEENRVIWLLRFTLIF